MTIQNKRLSIIVAAVGGLLLIPAIAMQFTEEVQWSPSDFVIAAFLLLSCGLLCELVLRKVKKTGQRLILCAVVLFIFFLVWAEMAVGIFGSPLAGS
jgi:hypothetical protein